MSSSLAIDVHDLEKSYSSVHAVHGIDLRVARGEIFALLGPNGAGKTTIVEILEGHRHRTSGQVLVLGRDPGKGERVLKERIGIVLQTTSVEPYLTVEETIENFRGYYPHPRPVEEVLRVTELTEQRKTRVRRLSGGQQRRLDVAVGLSGDPDLLFLDEPTTGFDPSARRSAWEMIKNLKSLGKTVFLTTHYMDEAQFLADRVAIIASGAIVAQGTPDEITGKSNVTTIRFRLPPGAPPLPASIHPELTDGLSIVQSETPTATLYDLTSWARAQRIELADFTATRPTLEDIYLELVKGSDDNATSLVVGENASKRVRGK